MPVPLPLILDEDSRGRALWTAIGKYNVREPSQSLDIIRVGDAGAPVSGILDRELIEWAISVSRVIVTQDVSTLVSYHNDMVAAGTTTPGLFVLRLGFGVSVLVGELALPSYCLTPSECACKVWYLPGS
jgi:hypothetical protein